MYITSRLKRSLFPCPDEYKIDCLTAWALSYANNNPKEIDSLFKANFPEEIKQVRHFIDFDYSALYLPNRDDFDDKVAKVDFVISKKIDKTYINQFPQTNIANTGWMWNTKTADFDNDGLQDLFVVNGFFGRVPQERNSFYRNLGNLKFEDLTDESGLGSYLPTTCYTYFDFDLDGDVDLVVTPAVGPVFIYENTESENQSISIQLNDLSGGNYYGINAKVSIYYDNGKLQIREILASGGFKSFDEPMAHFGLDDSTEVDEVIIEWSSGEKTIIDRPLKAGYKYKIVKSNNPFLMKK